MHSVFLVRLNMEVKWLLKVNHSMQHRLSTTSFVVALSLEHMAFHVFVQAGYSDPYLLCPHMYRINCTAHKH